VDRALVESVVALLSFVAFLSTYFLPEIVGIPTRLARAVIAYGLGHPWASLFCILFIGALKTGCRYVWDTVFVFVDYTIDSCGDGAIAFYRWRLAFAKNILNSPLLAWGMSIATTVALWAYGRTPVEDLDPFQYPCLPQVNPSESATAGHFRLPRIQRRLPFLGVEAEFSTRSLEDAGHYDAISYVWGGRNPATPRAITLNG